MAKELACGKAAKRTKGFGAQSMTSKEMEKFIIEHGTDGAKKALKAIKGPPSRGDLCVIFHTFRAGRAEIAKGEGVNQRNFRLTPSPNRARVMKVLSSLSSPNMSPNKTLKVFAFMEGKKKRNLRRVLKSFPRRPMLGLNGKPLKLKHEHVYGPRVYTGRRGHAREVSNKNANSGSNRNGGNYASGGSNNERVGVNNVHFVRGGLNNKRNVVGNKPKAVSRFNVTAAFLAQKVKAGERLSRLRVPSSSSSSRSSGSSSPFVPRPLKMIKFPRTGKLERVSTRSKPYLRPGTRAHVSILNISNADRQRWNDYKMFAPRKISPAQKSRLANSLLLKNMLGSSSNSNSSMSPKKKRATNVKARIMQKLKRMSRKKKNTFKNKVVVTRAGNMHRALGNAGNASYIKTLLKRHAKSNSN
jgi:hypothetical protein